MTAAISFSPKYSKMTLAVAKDSGWYDVDMTLGENFEWGKGEGCEIYNTSCNSSNASEFCSVLNEVGCSDNRFTRTKCSVSDYNKTCPINLTFESCKQSSNPSSTEFKYGVNSLCLNREVILF
jgi:hypothetical protein